MKLHDYRRVSAAAAAIIGLLMALSSCAGNSTALSATSARRSPAPASLSKLPPLPGLHAASAATPLTQDGSAYIDGAGAVGSLQAVSLLPPAGGIAWAMYSWDCSTNEVLSLSANLASGTETQVWVAVSDYASQHWALFGPYNTDTELDLSAGSFKNVSNALYGCIIAYAAPGSNPLASTVNSVTLTLDTTAAQTHNIAGSVLDGSGQPIAGLEMSLKQGLTEVDGVTTDVSGAYSFGDVIDGAYTVSPVVDAGTDVDPAATLDAVVSGADVLDLDFKVAPYESIGGTVLDESSMPVQGVTVNLAGGAGGTVLTDGSGQYLFAADATVDLSEGDSYTVTPGLGGYSFSPVSITGSMPAGGIANADFLAQSGATGYTVSGTITNSGGNPVQGVYVALGAIDSDITDGEGKYSFTGVADGDYTITPGVQCTPAAIDITVAGADYPGCDFETTDAGGHVISGHVTQVGSGNPVPNVDIKLTPGNRHATTDSNGYYEFTNTSDGNYTIAPQLILSLPPDQDVVVAGADVPDVDFVNNGPPPPG